MNENEMKKRLKALVVFTSCMLVFLFGAGIVVTNVFTDTFVDVTEEKMHEEAHNYKGRIRGQIQRSFQLMNSVSSLIHYDDQISDVSIFNSLKQVDEKNNFLVFGYVDENKQGYFSTDNGIYTAQIDVKDMQLDIQEAVQATFKGEEVVRDVEIEQVSDQRLFLFGVPVYKNGVIVGSLLGCDSIDAFSDVFDENNALYGRGFIHLLDSTGHFLIQGDSSAVQEKMNTVLGNPYMDEEMIRSARKKMENMKQVEFEFNYQGNRYQGLLEPLCVSDWYLFCVNSVDNVNKSIHTVAHVVLGLFFLVVGLFLYSLYMGYRMMKNMNCTLRMMAYYDDLTGLYNIKHFMTLVEEAVVEKKEYSIVVLNVRQFKFINEIFGQKQADNLLKYLGKMIKNELMEEEFACRESADNFYMFLNKSDKEALEVRMERFLNDLTVVEFEKRRNYQLVIRCGIAVGNSQEDPQAIMTRAMFALAKTKQMKNKNVLFFDETLHEQERMNNYVETNAQKALANEEFKLYLQPKVDLRTGKLCGAEALARWLKEDGTLLYPNSFIPMFEMNGFCARLDMYMVENVCKQLREWINQGFEPIPISINQSRMTFYEENYPQRLCDILDKYSISPNLITLEILEGLILEDMQYLNNELDQLRKLGFHISMDDFGTGYSSLNVLGKLKIDELKLDRGFLLEVFENNNENMKIVLEEVVRLSKRLNITTVIEGIETDESEDFVTQIGCDIGQGYLYSRPISILEFTNKFLRKTNKI